MKLVLAALSLAAVGTCAVSSSFLDAATAELDAKTAELHARIKAIDELSFMDRVFHFAERRRLNHEVTNVGTMNRVATSMGNMLHLIENRNITTATGD